MKPDELMDLLGDAGDEQILDARNRKKRMPVWVRWSSLAAACLLLIAGVFLLPGQTERGRPSEMGGSGHDEGSVFMSYAGPVFPLTTEEKTTLEAQRSFTWDFAGYSNPNPEIQGGNGHYVEVRDRYVLHNPESESQTVMAIYPVAGTLRTSPLPEITVNGETVDWALHAGAYSGKFTGVLSSTGMELESINLLELDSWEGYADLLADGSYLTDAFAEAPVISEPVTVYKLTDLTAGGSDAEAATLCIRAVYDENKTTVLTFGMNGFGVDDLTGEKLHSAFIREHLRAKEDDPKYLILLGEDWSSYTIQGYENGACEPGTELPAVSAQVERYESTLGEVLRELAAWHYDLIRDETSAYYHLRMEEAVSFDLYFETFRKFFAVHGPLGTAPKERYAMGRMDDMISETEMVRRILYLTFPVTIPAGERVTVEVQQWHPASFDYACTGSANQGIEGYDMVTQLGSTLHFTEQTAAVENWNCIEIVRQNFGFDPEQGITEVPLQPDHPHYFLEVREKPQP